MSSIDYLTKVTASVKRVQRINGRSTGSTSTVIPTLSVTQPTSIDYNTAQRVGTSHRTILESPYKYRMVLFSGDNDVEQGDIMTISGVDCPIRHVEKWPYIVLGETRMVAILEYPVRGGL